MADYLPQDVLVNIFTRLPIKTILRCTSVCKPWLSLIRNPSFIRSHLNRPQTQTYNNAHNLLLVRTCSDDESGKEQYSLHCDNDTFDEHAKLHFPLNRAFNDQYRIVGSCNGVLCLTDDQLMYLHETVLWNPTIRKWVRLPEPRVTFRSHGGFDHAIGFGFDAKSNDYKVVRIVHLDSGCRVPPEIDVYSLSSGTWRNITHLGLCYLIAARGTQAYLNGAVHWIGSDLERQCNMVVSFNMSDEVFHSMKPPAGVTFLQPWQLIMRQRLSPAVIQGSLSLVEQKGSGYEQSWCVWVMEEYGVEGSWIKLLDVGFGKGVDRLICFRKKGELLITVEGHLITCDPKAAEVKELAIRIKTGECYDSYEFSFHIDLIRKALFYLDVSK